MLKKRWKTAIGKILTASGLSSGSARYSLILLMETTPWMRETIPKGRRKSGPRIVLKRVRETKAVWASRMLLTGSIST